MQILEESTIGSPFELQSFVDRLDAKYWQAENHTLLLLTGDLGAGKTTLTRSFMKIFGIEESINSPTFNLLNEYSGKHGLLMHYDLYRLETSAELAGLDFHDRWAGRMRVPDIRTLHAIEWWQKAGENVFNKLSQEIPVYELSLKNPDYANNPMGERRQLQLKRW